jgi:MYXO-CTERM domain-containing protein
MQRKIGLVVALVGVGFFACGASAAVVGWEFTVDPTSEATPMLGYASDVAWPPDNGVYTPYGGTTAGTGLQGDGTAIFADAPTESANSGFVLGGFGPGYTLDVRVKVLENVTQTAGKSMSIVDSTGNGRGIKLRTDGLELVSGTSVVRGYGYDGTQWQILRFSMSGDGTVDPYLWDVGTNSFIPLGNQALGGSGSNTMGQPNASIGIGSLAGSSTQSGKFQIDWAYVDTTTARGGTPPPMPEPGTLALLALGAAPLLRRRR